MLRQETKKNGLRCSLGYNGVFRCELREITMSLKDFEKKSFYNQKCFFSLSRIRNHTSFRLTISLYFLSFFMFMITSWYFILAVLQAAPFNTLHSILYFRPQNILSAAFTYTSDVFIVLLNTSAYVGTCLRYLEDRTKCTSHHRCFVELLHLHAPVSLRCHHSYSYSL